MIAIVKDLEQLRNAEAYNFIKKETLGQVFFCEFWEISKNAFFYRTPPIAASDVCRSGEWLFFATVS